MVKMHVDIMHLIKHSNTNLEEARSNLGIFLNNTIKVILNNLKMVRNKVHNYENLG